MQHLGTFQKAVIRSVKAFLDERKKQNPFSDKMLHRIYHIQYSDYYRVTFSDGSEVLLRVIADEESAVLAVGVIIYDSTELHHLVE